MSIGGSFWRGGESERERFMVSGEVRVDAGEFACWRGGGSCDIMKKSKVTMKEAHGQDD